MFEDYLVDADAFYNRALTSVDEREAVRCFRVAILTAASSIEAFAFFIGETLSLSSQLQPYEVALLTDRRFGFKSSSFSIAGTEYHSIEDKLRLLLARFVPNYDLGRDRSWNEYVEFKRLRDSIVHPKHNDEVVSRVEFARIIRPGIASVIHIMNLISQGVFNQSLRRQLLDIADAL